MKAWWLSSNRLQTNESLILVLFCVISGISLEYLFSTVEGGAGTKVAMNLVGNFSVQQGTSGDLLIGLPTQMTEMHSPARILYLIDAPVAQVKVLEHSFLIRDVLGGC